MKSLYRLSQNHKKKTLSSVTCRQILSYLNLGRTVQYLRVVYMRNQKNFRRRGFWFSRTSSSSQYTKIHGVFLSPCWVLPNSAYLLLFFDNGLMVIRKTNETLSEVGILTIVTKYSTSKEYTFHSKTLNFIITNLSTVSSSVERTVNRFTTCQNYRWMYFVNLLTYKIFK